MGLLDSVIGALAGGGQQGGNNTLLELVLQLINNPQTGGLAGLIQSFQQGGLGEIADSWVSTGANQPISPEQLQSVLGNSSLAGLAEQLGLNQAQASGQLAELLPQLVDQLTPNGQLPADGDPMAQGLGLDQLKGKLFG